MDHWRGGVQLAHHKRSGIQKGKLEGQTMIENILLGVLGGGNLVLFIKFLIERHDRKKEKAEDKEQEGIKNKLLVLEKDGLRTQLLLLILIRPDEQTEILRIAEHYFKVLHGNWYMTSIFNNWLKAHEVAEPEWFEEQIKQSA